MSDAPPGAVDAPPAGAAPPPPADKPPGSAKKQQPSGAAKRRAAKLKGTAQAAKVTGAALTAELKVLEEKLSALLVAPSVPMHMAGDHWPGEHIEQRSPELAKQIVAVARRNPAFRAQLQKALSAGDGAQLAFAAAAYLGPVLIYYGLVPVPPQVRVQLEVPTRAEAREVPVEPMGGETAFQRVSRQEAEALRSRGGAPQAGQEPFTEQPPGTAGAPPAAAPGAAPAS